MSQDSKKTPSSIWLNLSDAPSNKSYWIEIATRTQALLDIWLEKEWVEGLKEKTPALYKDIPEKIWTLREIGFEDPGKLIRLRPWILSCTPDTVQSKIRSLKELWFDDPISLVHSWPTILKLSIENNIKPKLKLLDRFIPDTKITRQLLAKRPGLLESNINKIWIVLRWLQVLWLLDDNIVTNYPKIHEKELESFILAVEELKNQKHVTSEELVKKIAQHKSTGGKKIRQVDIQRKNEHRKSQKSPWSYPTPYGKLLHRYKRSY